jgi:hypothetical protein
MAQTKKILNPENCSRNINNNLNKINENQLNSKKKNRK